MFLVENKKMNKIDKTKKLIGLYSEEKSVEAIIDDYMNEIKDFPKKNNLFKFNLMPDSSYCKIEVVPSSKGDYTVDLERYKKSSSPSKDKERDIKAFIGYNLCKQKIIYLKKSLSMLNKSNSRTKKEISKFYESSETTLALEIQGEKIIVSTDGQPFVRIDKNDTDYKKEFQYLYKYLRIDITPKKTHDSQVKNISESLLYKQAIENMIESLNRAEADKLKYESFIGELEKEK